MWDEEIDAEKIITVKYKTYAIVIRKPELCRLAKVFFYKSLTSAILACITDIITCKFTMGSNVCEVVLISLFWPPMNSMNYWNCVSNFLSSDLQMVLGFLTGQSWCVEKTATQLKGFQQEHGGQWNSPAISHQLAAYFSLEINPVFYKWNEKRLPQNTNLGWKTKVLPQFWVAFIVQSSKPNTLLTSLAFPQNHRVWVPKQPNLCSNFHAFFGASFFFLCPLQSFCHQLKTLLKTLQLGTQTRILEVFHRWPQPEFSFVCDAARLCDTRAVL